MLIRTSVPCNLREITTDEFFISRSVKLTLMRSVQHGMAAKMSYEYMVPKTREDPSHLWLQNLQTMARPLTPSRHAMQTTVKNWVRPSTFTCTEHQEELRECGFGGAVRDLPRCSLWRVGAGSGRTCRQLEDTYRKPASSLRRGHSALWSVPEMRGWTG